MDFKKTIFSWYNSNKRDLSWRKTTDIYKIMVSEVMLQQTQVDRVIAYYNRWLKKFPNAKALAKASNTDVLKYWSGLGYNRRALFLKCAAEELVTREKEKKLPKTIEELQELSGIGPYAARAIAAFSWDKGVTATDTNIRRIFSRYYFKGAGSIESINKKIESETPIHGRIWNNALMDFGAMICTAKNPKCPECPFKKTCSAFKVGKTCEYTRIAPPQSKFEGSKRQYRGAILRLLLKKSMTKTALKNALIKELGEKEFIEEVIGGLEEEGIIQNMRGTYSLT
ncbi:MAG: A/G-specific adenine glycosylase [Candidatus Woesearchaeota archaeon]